VNRLERRCRALLRAYPGEFRAERGDEVLATMLDANAGRRAPRPGDVLDVVAHGLALRVRMALPLWGDSAAIALVGALTIGVALGVALVARFLLAGRHRYIAHHDPVLVLRTMVVGPVGVAALVAVYAGRQRLARWLGLLTALGVAGAVAGAVADGGLGRADPVRVGAVAAGAVVLLAALLLTRSVERATALVPRGVWPATAAVSTGVALTVVTIDVSAGAVLRLTEVVMVGYASCAGVLLLLALACWTARPRLTAAAALLCVPAGPAVVLVVWREIAPYGRAVPYAVPLAVAAVLVPLAIGQAALRHARPLVP
jgi:hypothetical protein